MQEATSNLHMRTTGGSDCRKQPVIKNQPRGACVSVGITDFVISDNNNKELWVVPWHQTAFQETADFMLWTVSKFVASQQLSRTIICDSCPTEELRVEKFQRYLC